jgi:hypothetical protein
LSALLALPLLGALGITALLRRGAAGRQYIALASSLLTLICARC